MKKVFKKNQIVIAVLAVMIAAAGYLNYSGKIFGSKNKTAETGSAQIRLSSMRVSFKRSSPLSVSHKIAPLTLWVPNTSI